MTATAPLGKGKRALFIVMTLLLVGVTVEVAARLLPYVERPLRGLDRPGVARVRVPVALDLDEYEMPDPERPGNWLLRPGFSQTLGEAIEAKRRDGRVLAVRALLRSAERLRISEDEVVLTVNRDGYKGPELDRTHSRTRILTLGDSCTFGTLLDRFSYPRTLERELRERGHDVEVVNGGVEGYAPRNLLLRIEELKALAPEITTLYVGWNALWGEPHPCGVGRRPDERVHALKLARRAYRWAGRTLGDSRKQALAAYTRPKHPDRDADELPCLRSYVPSFMDDVERLADEMRSAGSRVYLITLPGLYTLADEPSPRALEMGHLPEFTDNPYVLAALSESYNAALAALARRRGFGLIDLDGWSREALRPRDAQFFDSVHLHEESQQRIGVHLAGAIEPALAGGGDSSVDPDPRNLLGCDLR